VQGRTPLQLDVETSKELMPFLPPGRGNLSNRPTINMQTVNLNMIILLLLLYQKI